ncbi:ankyrin repeat domain-containing protein 33B [Rhinichthys klamathensis goyatoka]|uniref:ankyrin repeat domain-containing protein 33B n=1 Tax=Rhinichthys klamathensis goyatoka TaxID=3034132 RepID=UPI0024B5F889|nr:ankyrin repeat domain-containing protein 33B [Rhinichthys klamathensis goyatoka]
MAEVKVTVQEDPNLGSGPDEDASELSVSENDSDSGSVLSDDSVLPNYEREDASGGPANTLYQACAKNNAAALRRVLERGATRDEVMELDINGRNGLMLAVSKGFVDIVYGLNQCPFLDINHQDNDGNTALMIAAQAGFVTILTYILNYFSGVDMDIRDNRGFTALLKAVMQGSDDCVASLLMAGADINVVDATRGKNIREWALQTGRFDTLYKLRRLNGRPQAEQFCEKYVPEWPDLKELVAKATATKSKGQKVAHCLKSRFTFSFPHDPQDNGILDHMVRMTTSFHSPLVVTGCRPLCPSSPPEIGKRRLAVPELMQMHKGKKLEEHTIQHSNGSLSVASTSASLVSCCSDAERRGSVLSMASNGVRKFVPRSMARRNSVFPSGCIPQVQVTKSGEPTPKKEKKKRRTKGYLEPPIWKYKEAKEEKKKEKKKSEQEKAEKEAKKKVKK